MYALGIIYLSSARYDKGALDSILKCLFWLNFIYQVNIDC